SCGLAIGTDRRVAGDGRLGDNGANDAVPSRFGAVPHLPNQYSDAVSREQLHRSAGQEEQARRVAAALRFAVATARCYPGPSNQPLFKGSRRSELSWLSVSRVFIFPDT